MNQSRPFLRRFRLYTCVLCCFAVPSGCSLDTESTRDPTATPTAVTFGPDDVAVGVLLDRSQQAWDAVDSWTSETRIDGPDTSESSGTASVTTERVVLPNNRQILTTNGETIVSEEIIVDGTIYMRGTLVSTSIYPEASEETWISFSPDQAPPGTPLEQRVAYLTSSPTFPFESVTPETRKLPASPVGDVQVGDRTCAVYQFSTSDADSEGINYRIAFDSENRPCQLVKEGGGIVETTTWTYDADVSIAPPSDSLPVDEFPATP